MGVFGGKFLGFSYAGKTSQELGVIRTIQDRFDVPLVPQIKDVAAEAPNYDGVYFWGSDYDRRNITIPFAFDEITEGQLTLIRNLLNSRKIHQLIFDEEPEKIYPAIVSGQSKLDYVCFDVFKGDKAVRVYRGLGSFQFISYTPYMRSSARFSEELGQFVGAKLVNEYPDGVGENPVLPEGKIIGIKIEKSDSTIETKEPVEVCPKCGSEFERFYGIMMIIKARL